jgi:hypothetical protein
MTSDAKIARLNFWILCTKYTLISTAVIWIRKPRSTFPGIQSEGGHFRVTARFVRAITIIILLARLFKLDHYGVRMCPYLLYGHATCTGKLYQTPVELSSLLLFKKGERRPWWWDIQSVISHHQSTIRRSNKQSAYCLIYVVVVDESQ